MTRATDQAPIPYVDIVAGLDPIRDELTAAFAGVLERGQLILGPEVERFEQRFAELCGVEHAIGLNSGTDALILALRALDIGPGDEVITVPNSFVATASAIAVSGARPVFVDVREDLNLDPEQLEAAVTSHTRAIIPVHLTGRPAEMDAINSIAARHGLAVIEDAAQAVAARYRGTAVGGLGNVGCFSLHPLKTLGACGDGGVLTTNDPAIADRVRLYRNLGLQTRDDCTTWSSNSRLDTVQAALLLVKLRHLDEWTERRRANAHRYGHALDGLSTVRTPVDQPHEHAVYHTYVVQAEARDELKKHLSDHGIGSAVHYPVPIHRQSVAKPLGYAPGSLPMAEKLAGRILSLPVYPQLGDEQIDRVSSCIRAFYERLATATSPPRRARDAGRTSNP